MCCLCNQTSLLCKQSHNIIHLTRLPELRAKTILTNQKEINTYTYLLFISTSLSVSLSLSLCVSLSPSLCLSLPLSETERVTEGERERAERERPVEKAVDC